MMEQFAKEIAKLKDLGVATLNSSKSFGQFLLRIISSPSYTMGCLPVCQDNPQALASGLSYVQVDKHGITI